MEAGYGSQTHSISPVLCRLSLSNNIFFFFFFFLSQGFLISTEIKNFLYKEMILEMKYLKCYVMLYLTMLYILWNTNNNILNMNSLFPFCPLHTAQLQYQSSLGVSWSCHFGFDQLNRNKYNMCYSQICS